MERAVQIEKQLEIDPPHGSDEPVAQSEILIQLAEVCQAFEDNWAAIQHIHAAIVRRQSEYGAEEKGAECKLTFLLQSHRNLARLLQSDPPA